jgi:hypothetical protein
VLVSLDHPNIGHIYGLEKTNGTRALVLTLTDGPTLNIQRAPQSPRERSASFPPAVSKMNPLPHLLLRRQNSVPSTEPKY